MADYSEVAHIMGPMGRSPEEYGNADTGIFEAKITVECAWADRAAVFNQIIWTEYPHLPNTNAYAVDGRMRGWAKSNDAGNSLIGYERARITFTYNNRIEFVGGYWITEKLRPSTQFRPLDAREFSWESNDPTDTDAKPVRDGEAPAMRQVYLDYILTYHRVLLIPDAAVTHLGACNHQTVSSYTLNRSFPAETLTLVAAPASRSLYNSFTLRAWKLTYHFRYSPSGANTFWRADAKPPAWESIYRIGETGRYIQHPLMNFSLLIP